MAVRVTSTPEHAAVTCVQLSGRETELVDGEMNRTLGGILPLGGHYMRAYYMRAVAKFVVETVFATDCISE